MGENFWEAAKQVDFAQVQRLVTENSVRSCSGKSLNMLEQLSSSGDTNMETSRLQ
jgi:hypothetical protein